MRESYGTRLMTKPEGMLRQIIFPELALMDVATGDGRLLEADGKGVRDLPLTIYGQFVNEMGHGGSVVIGSLHEVTFEDGVASGSGWVLDDENGRNAVKYVKTQSLRGNSVDLAEVKARYDWGDDLDDDLILRFTQWKIAATTLVGKPAFGTARAELLEDDEIVASWMAEEEPLVVDVPITMNVLVAEDEVTADAAPRPSWSLFHAPEAPRPQKLTVGEEVDGFIPVSGHLALWESCHDGVESRCVNVPRPDDNYSSYNKPGVLTDKGMVGTGPIFLTGGHKSAPDGDYFEAYGGIENVWADIHIVPGTLGPWCSGYVRPGTDESKVLAARASRVSGHWKGTRLKAIVCVNAEGFDVPGDGFGATGMGFAVGVDGRVEELVASLWSCDSVTSPPVESGLDDRQLTKARLALSLAMDDDD